LQWIINFFNSIKTQFIEFFPILLFFHSKVFFLLFLLFWLISACKLPFPDPLLLFRALYHLLLLIIWSSSRFHLPRLIIPSWLCSRCKLPCPKIHHICRLT
jgi:hypothetical protein